MENSANIGHLQSAYQALHSTKTAMDKVVSDLLSATDGSNPSTMLYLIISVVFDTLDHCHLVERAQDLFCFSESILDWLQSYPAGRQQYVAISSCNSPSMPSTSGVPHGSVLGSLLFSIFTTPVGHLNMPIDVSYQQYADATNGLANLSACIDAVAGWNLADNLMLNRIKTEAPVSGTRQQIAKLDSIAQTRIPIVYKIRVLCVTFDGRLSF